MQHKKKSTRARSAENSEPKPPAQQSQTHRDSGGSRDRPVTLAAWPYYYNRKQWTGTGPAGLQSSFSAHNKTLKLKWTDLSVDRRCRTKSTRARSAEISEPSHPWPAQHWLTDSQWRQPWPHGDRALLLWQKTMNGGRPCRPPVQFFGP